MKLGIRRAYFSTRSLPAHAQLGDPLVADTLTTQSCVASVKASTQSLTDAPTSPNSSSSNPISRSLRHCHAAAANGAILHATLVTERAKSLPVGPWTNRFVKCLHCGGSRWHHDCPKRLLQGNRRNKDGNGQPSSGRAALVSAHATADENLDAAIGNVLLAADAQPRFVKEGNALCVRAVLPTHFPAGCSSLQKSSQRRTSASSPWRSAKLSSRASEDELSSDGCENRDPPEHGGRFYAYERAGGFFARYGIPTRKTFAYPGEDHHCRVPEREKRLPFVEKWPGLEICDRQETWHEAVELHNTKLSNRRFKR
eukprot:2840779-Pleurochrysis_carterae.AAC.4